MSRIVYVVARFPKSSDRILRNLSCELPPVDATPIQKKEFSEFYDLALECGAIGFYREEL